MAYSTDINLFWELLELSNSCLYIDNDCCYIGINDDDKELESTSFDFGPKDLVFIMADKLDIDIESV